LAKRSREPRWLSRTVVDAIHADQLRQHGGLAGIRDENALASALARAKHKWSYGDERDVVILAAAYGFGLARNHPYRDGNKRIAFLAMATFLGVNGYELIASDADVVTTMMALASGKLTEGELAGWLREHRKLTRLQKPVAD
jgi:death on curing protein